MLWEIEEELQLYWLFSFLLFVALKPFAIHIEFDEIFCDMRHKCKIYGSLSKVSYSCLNFYNAAGSERNFSPILPADPYESLGVPLSWIERIEQRRKKSVIRIFIIFIEKKNPLSTCREPSISLRFTMVARDIQVS